MNKNLCKRTTKEVILTAFDKFLDTLLQQLEDYFNEGEGKSFRISCDMGDDIPAVARELGFECHRSRATCRRNHEPFYVLWVANLQYADEMCPVHVRLSEFKRQLDEARKKRENELIEECKRVKECMDNGECTYSTRPESKFDMIINVKSKQEINNWFEMLVIKRFFLGTDYRYSPKCGNVWKFYYR